jgi:flagellin
MLSINTNIGSIIAANQLNRLNTESEKLNVMTTTGKRISSASDDPTGMAILMGMTTQLRGNNAAQTNIARGVDMLKSEEGMFKQFDSIFGTMKELALTAATDTTSDEDRIKANTQLQEYMTQLTQIAESTNYNSIKLGDGSVASMDLQIGNDTSASNKITYTLTDMKAASLTIAGGDITSKASATAFIDNLQTDFENLTTNIAKNGAVQSRLSYVSENITNMNEQLSKSMKTIGDADMAKVAVDSAKNAALTQLGIKMMAMSNQQPLSYLSMFA